jgi:DNA-binding LacI/PurR family transcriptional regulator
MSLDCNLKRFSRCLGINPYDSPWSTLLRPPLSVVAQPAYDLGVESARLLLSQLEGYAGVARTVTLSPTLVVRGSSVPVRKAAPKGR